MVTAFPYIVKVRFAVIVRTAGGETPPLRITVACFDDRGEVYFCLLQREKVADVSAKQIYDRLRSSRMTDEVLLTVFVNYN